MAIIFTGTTITAVKHTTTDIDTVVHTGTTVFTSGPTMATAWNTTTTQTPLTASFETQDFFNNPTENGCGISAGNLPSATNYTVGTIVRGRLNTSGSTCPTWRYFIAV